MPQQPTPLFRTIDAIPLIGTMAIYSSQTEAAERIPHQWRDFRSTHPALAADPTFYGASPCTPDHKIHYLTGVPQTHPNAPTTGDRLALVAGEYAVVRVDDPTQLRDTWIYLLTSWLPTSGRREKHAPEFERFTAISDTGLPTGPVEIWIPLEPPATDSNSAGLSHK